FRHRGPVPEFLLCSSPFLFPSERLLGLLGADRVPDYRVGHYSTEDESAPRDADIRASSPRHEAVVRIVTTVVRIESTRGDFAEICCIVSHGLRPASSMP